VEALSVGKVATALQMTILKSGQASNHIGNVCEDVYTDVWDLAHFYGGLLRFRLACLP